MHLLHKSNQTLPIPDVLHLYFCPKCRIVQPEETKSDGHVCPHCLLTPAGGVPGKPAIPPSDMGPPAPAGGSSDTQTAPGGQRKGKARTLPSSPIGGGSVVVLSFHGTYTHQKDYVAPSSPGGAQGGAEPNPA